MTEKAALNALTGLNVLVVDDNAPMRRLIGTLLQIMGAPTIHEAASGLAAADLLTETPMDLMICDWQMGEMSGLELIKIARLDGYQPNPLVPIVAVSAYSDSDMVRSMYAAGANAVMAKPIGISTFMSIVSRITSRPNAFRQTGTWFGPERGTGARVQAIH